ncbi:MAG: FKBP-type peptidyl-prolyl cis-trans isomerase [Gemmataceae bacterium]|nr:FKBP-type peptidyl-prolyl cis-trans isomerase [Gemmataceae bacterium]
MAGGQAANTPGGDPDGRKWMTILVPAAGVALLVGLVVVVAAINQPDKPGGKGGRGGKGPTEVRARRSPLPNNPTTLSDGTAPGAEDPNLKDLGGGLKYRDLKEGDGEECPPGGHPIMDYAGWLLLDGKPFDTSFKPGGRPLDQYTLAQLIQGWQKAVPGMKVGGIRKLVVPSDMGYGARGSPPNIPPNADLVFEIELLGLK